MTIAQRPFGHTAEGQSVECFTLRDGRIEAEILTYGGILRALHVPDRDGRPVDVVLGFDRIADYEAQDKYIGALIGRCANRIAGGRFTLGGNVYQLACNNGENHLHGGQKGFDRRVWKAEIAHDGLVLRLSSEDGEERYPGALDVVVVMSLQNGGLCLDYQALALHDTLCNLTNHSYFNLAGHAYGSIAKQTICLESDLYTPTDTNAIPTGVIANVFSTPMDLRIPTPIGAKIDTIFDQLRMARGYDHNWVIRGVPGTMRLAATAFSPETGIELKTFTTQPGIQFYTGNFLGDQPPGKNGVRYGIRSGFCLETQCYPDAIHHENFPSPILRAGHIYRHQTVYQFSRS